MSTFQRCPAVVTALANEVLCQFDSHRPLLDARVKIDYVFAFADVDPDSGERKGYAIQKDGRQVFGQARKIDLKGRALGRGDCEVCLDGDWWNSAPDEQQRALLDHELFHFALKLDKHGNIQKDDLNRPQLKLRKHDVEFGWFAEVAARHGNQSMERIQAKQMADTYGQFFWPDIFGTIKAA